MEYQLPLRGVRLPDDPMEEHKTYHVESHNRGTYSTNIAQLSEEFRILPVPTDTDDLETTCTKLEELAKVVEQGNSLALFTGLKLATQRTRDPESVAKAQLTPDELMMYESWKAMRMRQTTRQSDGDGNGNGNGIHDDDNNQNGQSEIMQLPDFNWAENVAPVPQGAQSLKKFTRRAEAMDVVFGHEGATPENASWLTSNMIFMLPLVKAVTKVCNIGKHLENTSGDRHMRGLTDMEAAEVETVRRLVAIAGKNRTREMEKIHRLTRSIQEAMLVLKARADALERS
ncbi:uncharacterized protein BO80DRAFT_423974 [Aspergillus ibericus CBS 121593]|uniref:Uncharacterized protein n=1 Tax=Aspergillus ibericus CBS 121593 TaxID=1448316 RepID=A0A395H351_9EURO|nr:hypothetical protein BO80DRAFT_423974 [Aspergillus ibericus CBS 121593]RAL02060.1 hypothetical protein BO80DRAFT_423974 [Aspergillus ibericus CBS 121593]